MKTIVGVLLLIILFLVQSCTGIDGESHQRYTSYIDIYSTVLPDSVSLGDTIPVAVSASAPNGCWSDLTIYLGRSMAYDTIYGIKASGLYESWNGLCAEVLITTDTVFRVVPDSAATYVFISYSATQMPVYDTVVVFDPGNTGR